MKLEPGWNDDIWGSPLIEELERLGQRVERLGQPPPPLSPDTVLEEIKSRARAISAQSSDHHVSDLADFVLVLASMMKDRDKRAEPGEPLPGTP
jgi:hypothetical protein